LQTPPRIGYASFDELYAQWEAYLAELTGYLVARQAEATQWVGQERPNPFFSALTADCIERGLDRAVGGVRYHGLTVEGFGWANLADALTSIKQLVFDEGRYTLAELTVAAQADFAGHEGLLADLRDCPKYGNADVEADALAARVTATFAALVTAHNHDNLYYLPSYHTLNVHVYAGAKLPASLDGRRAGQPLGKNAGPLPENRRGPLTALLLSASAIDQRALSGGQALDISVDPKLLADAEDRRKLQALLLTYFARGGLQIQVNGLGAEELREAIAEPHTHRDLIVRIAGYSARFVDLGLPVQEEMVQRFEVGL
ncbi:MAG: pyruvate formate lyase family protein, partial [Armatimonadota bacterium]